MKRVLWTLALVGLVNAPLHTPAYAGDGSERQKPDQDSTGILVPPVANATGTHVPPSLPPGTNIAADAISLSDDVLIALMQTLCKQVPNARFEDNGTSSQCLCPAEPLPFDSFVSSYITNGEVNAGKFIGVCAGVL